MRGVRHGLLVAWGPAAPGHHLGTVLDRAPDPSSWWVLPDGKQVAVVLHSRDLRSAPNRPRPVAPWDPARAPRPKDEPLSDAEPGPDDVPMVDLDRVSQEVS